MDIVKENKMGTQPVGKLLLSMSLPAMFSMLVQSLYNVIDSIFVAQLGENALRSVSLVFPVQIMIIAIGVGTGVGINSVISRRLGERRIQEANDSATHGIILALFSSIIFALFGLFFSKGFFTLFTDEIDIIAMGTQYIWVVTVFSFGIFIQIACEKILQATGNMIYPMLFQLTGALTNIIFDPILIFGLFGLPKLGVLGAALATVLGQMVAMLFSIIVLFKKTHEVKVHFKGFRLQWNIIKGIYAVGLPAIIMQSIGSILIMGLNGILSQLSGIAVSVLGIYFKLQSFVFMPVFGLTQGAMPIMGYNYGAKNKDRLLQCAKLSSYIAIGIMAIGTAIFQLFPTTLLRMFNASEEMLTIGVIALRVISLAFIPAAIGIITSTLFQAIGHGIKSLIVSVLRQLVLVLPVAWLLAHYVGLNAVWYSFPFAEIFSLIASTLFFINVYHKQIKPM